MTPGIRPLVAGNWKMNGTEGELGELRSMAVGLDKELAAMADGLICPPATLLSRAADAASGTALALGGQDCHANQNGAHTGDISAEMIADAGGSAVIVGHSERRTDHGEDDAMVLAKASAAWRAGLVAIICIGETESEREAGTTMDVLTRQIEGSVPKGALASNTVIAYEPVWAIGTGKTPTAEDVAEAHAHIRERLGDHIGTEAETMRLLYGGSVKPSNASDLLGVFNVDGALVGGASLKASDFLAIAETYRAS